MSTRVPITRPSVMAGAILLTAGVIFTVLLLVARLTGQTDLPPLKLFLLLPLLGGLLALARLTPAHLLVRERASLIYGLFCLALVAWGLSGLWILVASHRNAAIAAFPSLGDVGYIAGGLLWSVAIWIIYEGVVTDFLSEVEANAFLLSAMAVTTIFVLSVAGGADLLESIKAGGNTLQIVALAYPLIYGFNVIMLMRLVHGERGAMLKTGRRPLMIIVPGLILLYLAQMAWSTSVILDQRLSGNPAVVKTSDVPQMLYILAYVVLALGVVSYPLPEPPTAHPRLRTSFPRQSAS